MLLPEPFIQPAAHSLCALQLCQKRCCMKSMGTWGLFPVFWLSFRVNQEVCTCCQAKHPFQKCWGRACNPVIMYGQTLLHTCQSKGQRGNARFGLPLVLEESQVSCLVRKTGYTAFSSWVQVKTPSSLVGWGSTESHLPRSCVCDGCILQPVSCREAERLDWILSLEANSVAIAAPFRIRTSEWTLYSFQVSFVFLPYLKIYLLHFSVFLVFPSTSFPFVSF